MKFKLKELQIREGWGEDEDSLVGEVSFVDEQESLCNNEFVIRLNEKECLEITDLIADKISKTADEFVKQLKQALKIQEPHHE